LSPSLRSLDRRLGFIDLANGDTIAANRLERESQTHRLQLPAIVVMELWSVQSFSEHIESVELVETRFLSKQNRVNLSRFLLN
jgi:hypothetical protein